MPQHAVRRRGARRLVAFLLGGTALSGLPALGAPLDPLAYASLGTLNVTSGSITIDTTANTLTVSGGATFTGVTQTQAGGPSIAVFDFTSVTVGSGVGVSLTGANPLAILSRGSMTFAGGLTIDASTLGGGAPAPLTGGGVAAVVGWGAAPRPEMVVERVAASVARVEAGRAPTGI